MSNSSESSDTIIAEKITDLEMQNKSLLQQNLDLQKKLDILEDTIDYHKTAFADSQKAIQEVSKYSKKLRSENDRLLKRISELESKN